MTDHEARRQPPVQFRPGPLGRALAVRGDNPNEIAQRDIERYYAILDQELATVDLTEAEALTIIDATTGWYVEPHTARLLWAEVEDAIRLGQLSADRDIDGDALITKLRALTPAQAMAIIDAVERWWRLRAVEDAAPPGVLAESAGRLAVVGLIR